MKIRNVTHKGLRRFILADDAAGIQPSFAPKLRRMISFLQDMESEDELRSVPIWKAHKLTGDRKGAWSLSISANWRLTFLVDREESEILNLDIVDYH